MNSPLFVFISLTLNLLEFVEIIIKGNILGISGLEFDKEADCSF